VIGGSQLLVGKLSTLSNVDTQQCYVDLDANLKQLKYCEEQQRLDTSRVKPRRGEICTSKEARNRD